jgi:phage shock protein PspC (stress-responsive transcriptional regulator)
MHYRVLKKSHDSTVAGICAGIAEYFGWDTGSVRTVFIFLALFGGSGLLLYLVLYFLMPPA